ncbi:MAG: LamG-like jellyroll fold domain-containing protein [Planctomycetota bacterium]
MIPLPCQAEVQEIVRFRMGEGAQNAERLVAATGDAELIAIGRPVLTDRVDPRAIKSLRSSHAVRLAPGDGYRLAGLPAAPQERYGVEVWARPAAGEGFRTIVNYGGRTGFGLALNNDGAWGVVYGKATVGWKRVGSGTWVHLAMVVEDGKGRFFVNGEPAGEAEDAAGWGYEKDGPMTIAGLINPDQHAPFAGEIDEVRVFTFEPGAFEPTDLLYFADADTGGQAAEASILFEREPVAQGLTFERNTAGFSPVDGQQAWAAERSSSGTAPWLRELNLNFTDERFREGRMPIVDIEVLARHNVWAGIHLFADTASGSREVGWTWGGSPEWKLLKVELDDAFFGARDHGNPDDQRRADGYDLRLFGAHQPLHVRRITVRGYARSGEVDWTRLLRVDRPRGRDTHGNAGLMMFANDGEVALDLPIRNVALEDAQANFRLRVYGDDGRLLGETAGDMQIATESSAVGVARLSPKGWGLGSFVYRYDVLLPDGTPIRTIEGRLGVYSGKPKLAKAEDDEFLYGLQHADNPLDPQNAAWLDLLGVDILRGVVPHQAMDEDRSRTDAQISQLAGRGIRVMPVFDPPKPGSPINYVPEGMDPAQRERELSRKEAFLESFARDYAGRVVYYELGNEPDLPFFYPGPVEEYVDSFRRMRAAIKRADPAAVVMTGGLCFHTEVGDRRARRIIELLSPDGVDAWAYHAHGAGYEAERDGWERQREATAAFDADHLPFIETETGMAAIGPTQVREQARTVVEKFVYSQSKQMPAMFFFALHFQDGQGPYTMAEHQLEPRPSVMAYRSLVQALRGHEFVEHVAGVPSHIRAYRFASSDGASQRVVAWSVEDRSAELRLGLGDSASDVEVIDMFGNRNALDSRGSVASVRVGVDPVFLAWRTDLPGYAARVLPSLVEVDSPVRAVEDRAAVTAQVRLPVYASPGEDWRLRVSVYDEEALIGVWERTLLDFVESSGAMAVSADVRLDREAESAIAWPAFWRVQEVAESEHAIATASLMGKTGAVWAEASPSIDIGGLMGGFAERREAKLIGYVWASEATNATIGAGADWWMAWSVNGEPAYSTLETGNGGSVSPDSHVFALPLRQGWNEVACRVLSGSAGWSFAVAGPDRLPSVVNADRPSRRVLAELVDTNGGAIASAVVPWMNERPLVASPDEFAVPLLAIGESDIVNDYVELPDASLWYSGSADLSGHLWVTSDDEHLIAKALFADDVHRADGDAVSVRVDAGGEEVVVELRPTRMGDGVTAWEGRLPLLSKGSRVALTIDISDADEGLKRQRASKTVQLYVPN